jgi:hypothetical protein
MSSIAELWGLSPFADKWVCRIAPPSLLVQNGCTGVCLSVAGHDAVPSALVAAAARDRGARITGACGRRSALRTVLGRIIGARTLDLDRRVRAKNLSRRILAQHLALEILVASAIRESEAEPEQSLYDPAHGPSICAWVRDTSLLTADPKSPDGQARRANPRHRRQATCRRESTRRPR